MADTSRPGVASAVRSGARGIPPWLPNAISVLRIVLVPVWGLCAEMCRTAVLASDAESASSFRIGAVLVLVAIGVSDVLDGYLARRFGLTSRTGATLDAMADKLAQVALLLFFTFRGSPAFPTTAVWFLGLILGRDVLLGIGWLVLWRRSGSVRVVHRVHGKFSSVLLFVLLFLLTADATSTWTLPLVWSISAIVLVSTAAYFRDGMRQA